MIGLAAPVVVFRHMPVEWPAMVGGSRVFAVMSRLRSLGVRIEGPRV